MLVGKALLPGSAAEELGPTGHLATLKDVECRRSAANRRLCCAHTRDARGRPGQLVAVRTAIGHRWRREARDPVGGHHLVLEHRGVAAVDPIVKVAELVVALGREVVAAHEDDQGHLGLRVHLKVSTRKSGRHLHTEVLVVASRNLELVAALRRDNDVTLAVLASRTCVVAVTFADTVLPALPVARAEGVSLHEVPTLHAPPNRADGGAAQVVPEERVERNDEGAVDTQDAVHFLPRKVPHIDEAEDAAAWAHCLGDHIVVPGSVLLPSPKRGGIMLLEGRWDVRVQ
mmetsp:Transcript_6873/g.19112  ORF Transcript_6873/g.19112 Transcript_6873/m.19112 type:complete len:287 (-) Transcript_6873:425-1285(-)